MSTTMITPTAGRSALEYLDVLNSVVYPHTQFDDAFNQLVEVIQLAPASARPCSGILVGDSGLGKSKLADWVQAHFSAPPIAISEELVSRNKPVLIVEMADPSSIKSLSEAILKALGDHEALTLRSISQMTDRVVTLLRTCKVQAVLLDEVHHLLEKGGSKTKNQIRNWIKSVMNQTMIPIILIGKPNCLDIIREDDQIESRYGTVIHFRPLRLDLSLQSEFRRILHAHTDTIRRETPLTEVPDFASEDLAIRLFAVTGGRLVYLFRLLNQSAYDAIVRGATALTIQDLTQRGAKISVAGNHLPAKKAFGKELANVRKFAELLDLENYKDCPEAFDA